MSEGLFFEIRNMEIHYTQCPLFFFSALRVQAEIKAVAEVLEIGRF
jgi:hypothetical protein